MRSCAGDVLHRSFPGSTQLMHICTGVYPCTLFLKPICRIQAFRKLAIADLFIAVSYLIFIFVTENLIPWTRNGFWSLNMLK